MAKQKAKKVLVVPRKHAGKWIAWNSRETKIVASARTLAEARRAAALAGEREPILEKVPRTLVGRIGAGA